MWVRITGVGDSVMELENEIQKIKDNNYSLNFRYPTEEELNRIDKIYSDYADLPENKKIREILPLLKNGTIDLMDLSDDMRRRVAGIGEF